MLIDIEEKPAVRRKAAVYRFFDERDRLLYVGSSIVPNVRCGQHRKEQAWWYLVKRTEVQWFASESLAHWIESVAIFVEKPVCNVKQQDYRSQSAHMRNALLGRTEAGSQYMRDFQRVLKVYCRTGPTREADVAAERQRLLLAEMGMLPPKPEPTAEQRRASNDRYWEMHGKFKSQYRGAPYVVVSPDGDVVASGPKHASLSGLAKALGDGHVLLYFPIERVPAWPYF